LPLPKRAFSWGLAFEGVADGEFTDDFSLARSVALVPVFCTNELTEFQALLPLG
jgi:hypothetical protein